MKKLLGITLGIMTALGGFVDLGQIVLTTQAGALFGYGLLWAVLLGTAAIIVYMEMCGRIAVVTGKPTPPQRNSRKSPVRRSRTY
jgi:Mn2+/Fe2+ NRAMP family transporter